MAKHATIEYKDRTYAEEVSKYYYYRHDDWDLSTRDRDFGKVKVGDYVLQYCTGDVEDYPGEIKNIYEVEALEVIKDDIDKAIKTGKINKEEAERLVKNPHILRLRLHLSLNKGLELAQIRKWVQEGKLSKSMNNCGKLGFNICQVDIGDYNAIIEWNKSQPPEISRTLGDLLEEDLRNYLAKLPTLDRVLGDEYKGYTLYKGPDGETGELYDTKIVGQIDLLYQNEKGDFLVIELKRTEDTSDKAVGQIARYLGWVETHLAKGKNVKSLIITRSSSEELRYAVKALKNCKLFTYELQFKFSPS
ncbi:MAG: hypothetical protein QXQ94_09340 [Candidatus Bathyarchaeia archaeon]